jgi:hypothetical protein
MNYTGEIPFDGLSDVQQRAVESATKLCPPDYHDGIWRSVAATLGGNSPWDNATVKAALVQVFANLGLDSPFLLET